MNSSRFQPGLGRQLAEDQEGACAREAAAFRIEEELWAVPHVQERASASQVTPECLCSLPADRHDPLLGALADAANDPRVEVDARLLQADCFADPQACPVQELDKRAVAQSAWRRPVRGLDETFGFSRGKRARQCAASSRQVELGGGIVGTYTEQRLMAEEGADRGDPPRDRRWRQTGGAQLCEVLLELLRRDPADGPVEPGCQRGEVATVRVDCLRRAASRKQREKALDLGIGRRWFHRAGFVVRVESPARGGVCAQGQSNEIAAVLAPLLPP